VDKAFSKTRAADRREWISAFRTGHHLDNAIAHVPIHDFVDKELVLFSRADLERSIPSVVDGLKPSQRKVLFAAFKRNLTSDIKVAQFGGYVAEHAAYHHGDASLTSTIVNMAQNFVGSNNVNWLVPSGQFGTRLMGGKDAASARYVFTRLSPETRRYFHPEDDAVLEYLDDDGMSIEPRWYVPVIPTILVNGSEGIGTGWSTSIPCYDPADIVANVRRMIRDEDLVPMTPWYRGFKGSIERRDETSFTTRGLYTIRGKHVEITELPVGMWTQDAKELLDALVAKGVVQDYKENHSDTSVRFDIEFSYVPSTDEIVKIFKLETTIRTSNMHAFDADGHIRKYESPEDILREWFVTRKHRYVARKAEVLRRLDAKVLVAKNKARFITAIVDGSLVVTHRKVADVVNELDGVGYDRVDGSFAYLLNMSIQTLTNERVDVLTREARELDDERCTLERTSVDTLWLADITHASSAVA